MATRLLVMFSFIILELGLGIAAVLGVVSSFSYRQIDEAGAAGIVIIVCGVFIAWLITIALFVRKSSREKARRLVAEAQSKAAQILADAADRSLALCSLDGGRCEQCGNPRTGRFCPKCGKPAGAAGALGASGAAGGMGATGAGASAGSGRAVAHAQAGAGAGR